jgi:hypothetical protein
MVTPECADKWTKLKKRANREGKLFSTRRDEY